MSAEWGKNLRLTIFGESHGPGVGIVIDGLPAGLVVDEAEIATELARRAPGQSDLATSRKEADQVRIVSGVYRGRTCGTPLCGFIANSDTRSADYDKIAGLLRPGHADYTGYVHYHGFNDPRGSGHFSGRITAPLVFAGALARAWLKKQGVEVAAHIQSLYDVRDEGFDPCLIDKDLLSGLRQSLLPTLDPQKAALMAERIREAQKMKDSLGGVVECAALGLPAGWGEPFFNSIESNISSLLFSIPAVKGVEFGSGFAFAGLRGSEANDSFIIKECQILTETNHNGGINGGITNGMPLIVRAAVKPTPSIGLPQKTVNRETKEECSIEIAGRHDPCIVPRALPVIEAAVMLALADCGLEAVRG